MAKANKGNKAATAPVPAPLPQATTTTTANGATKGVWCGYTVCGLLRAVGYAGYTPKQATALLHAVGLPTTSPSTVGCQVGAGRQYARGVQAPHHTGAFVPLGGDVLACVVQAVGQPANPVQGTPAPLPAPRVPGVVPAPVAPPAPPAPPAKPRKGSK